MGLWLGDGNSGSFQITNTDDEIRKAIIEYGEKLGIPVNVLILNKNPNHTRYKLHMMANRVHSFLNDELYNLRLISNKHIPQHYLVNSTENRLSLLAGLLDSDGHYLVDSNGYEITQKNQDLARQIKFLCDTLGFRTSLTKKKAQITSINYECDVWRVRIYGDIDKIPVKVERKKARAWASKIDWRVTGFKIEYDKVDDYYGFEIDGNRLFLLEDMTVTHNTAFVVSALRNAAVDHQKAVAIFSLEMSAIQLVNRLLSAEAELNSEKIKKGNLMQYEWEQLHSKITKLTEAPIFIDDTPALSVLELRAKARRLKAQHNIELLIVDYLQLMSGGDGGNGKGNREQEIAFISRSLKNIAKELDIPVIALSQLSRAVETRGGDKKPMLSDLRESGCITGDSLIVDACTGALVPIRELAERTEQTPFTCLGATDAYKVTPQNMVKAFYSGKKEVFEIKTRTGKHIKASANHPFMKLEGWTRLDKLKVGDKIATIIMKNTLKNLANSDIYWDEIISITPLGEQDVYDATVENVHNFVANDFILHNSIEQDADMVIFLYRPEYYKITQDENGMPCENMAEVIIAKHRNGSLDTVKLKFIGEFTKFGNMDNFGFGADTTFSSEPTSFPTADAPNQFITLASKMNDTKAKPTDNTNETAPF